MNAAVAIRGISIPEKLESSNTKKNILILGLQN
jgi:hypothetical protein